MGKKLSDNGRLGGKTPVRGFKNREAPTSVATPVASVKRLGIEKMRGESASEGEVVFMDTSTIYAHVASHESVVHSNSEYARGALHIKGIE